MLKVLRWLQMLPAYWYAISQVLFRLPVDDNDDAAAAADAVAVAVPR